MLSFSVWFWKVNSKGDCTVGNLPYLVRGCVVMLIPVAKVLNREMYVVYNTDTNQFDDISGIIYNRQLPVQDYMSCCVYNHANLCTIIGKVGKDYVVNLGDNQAYLIDRDVLNGYSVTNAKIDSLGRLRCMDKLVDLSYLFPDMGIKFLGVLNQQQKSSIGQAKKFFCAYKGQLACCKFSKSNGQDLANEVLIYKTCKLLGVKCCRTVKVVYNGKPAILSFYDYRPDKDIFMSFKQCGKSISEIYDSLSKQDKMEFDKMMLLDYITLQQDRHMSNLAIKNGGIYPLFDNGDCMGVGGVGYFSAELRRYVERLDKQYVRHLVSGWHDRLSNDIMLQQLGVLFSG